MELDLNSVRLERAETRVVRGPFPVVEVDNFLPAPLYAHLLETYPDPRSDGVNHSMKNYLKSGTVAFDAFLQANPAWSNLIRYLDSDQFIGHVYDFALPIIRDARGPRSSRPWCRNGVPIAGAQTREASLWPRKLIEVETGFELSSMENGHCITPHSDTPYKLVSILLYFPFADWKQDWGGGTQFFKPMTHDAEVRWCNTDVNHIKHFGEAGLKQFASEMECFHTAAFVPNRLAMFCKANNTFHAVDTIRCPSDRRRNTLVMNINMKEWQQPAWQRAGARWWRRAQQLLGKPGRPPLRPVASGDGYD
jgi:hypothetical protein